ncbi:hypothetical protein GQ44DRAFT_755229 [Phaeosphaeriaceae sp. PMI808]|nr:hypothetical protein GQ44DRAFT_755229 [Phaeosphaeriaceae sp. PMI808]
MTRLGLWSHVNKRHPGVLSPRYLLHNSSRSQVFPANIRVQTYTSHVIPAHTPMETPRAPFLSSIQQCLSTDSPWGFVIYRITAYAPNEVRTWEIFQQKFNSMIQETFDSAAGPEEEISAARKGWTLRWEEGSTMAEWALEDVKKHYEVLLASKTLPAGLSHPLCLVVTPAVVKSVLNAPSPLPRFEYSSGGRGAPFVIGVDLADIDEEDEDEEDKYSGHFNVSVQCLIDGLWPILIEQMADVEELGRGVKDDDIWGM